MARRRGNENFENTQGEVIGYRVDLLPLKVEPIVDEETGKVHGSRTLNPRIIGVVTVRVEEEGRMKSIPINCNDFSECLDGEVNWDATKTMRSKIFKQMMKAAPYGATVPLLKKPGRTNKDKPFYLLEVETEK